MHSILDGAPDGGPGVGAMYMMGENPFMSDPNTNKVRKALSALDFLVVQDIFVTETAEFADVILPATSYLEKDGTYTNTDRRVQRGRKVARRRPARPAPTGGSPRRSPAGSGWTGHYASPREVFDEMVAADAELPATSAGTTSAAPASSTRTTTRSTPTAPS